MGQQRASDDCFPWIAVDVLFPAFCTLATPFLVERNSAFLQSKRSNVIPFLWNLFPQNFHGNPSFQTGP